jgi:hypothetical protein
VVKFRTSRVGSRQRLRSEAVLACHCVELITLLRMEVCLCVCVFVCLCFYWRYERCAGVHCVLAFGKANMIQNRNEV